MKQEEQKKNGKRKRVYEAANSYKQKWNGMEWKQNIHNNKNE